LNERILAPLLMNNAITIVTELPITLIYLENGAVYSERICTGWIVLNYSLFLLSITLMAWASVERYLFIHHEPMITGHYILLHYVPVGCLLLYCPLFYLGTVLLYKCKSNYNVYRYVCGGPCYQYQPIIGSIDRLGNVLCVVLVTFVINLILIIRHIIQRHRMKRCIITTNGKQQWVRIVFVRIQINFLYMIASLIEIDYASTFALVTKRDWMDSIFYDYIYSNLYQYSTIRLSSFDFLRLYAIFTDYTITLHLSFIYAQH